MSELGTRLFVSLVLFLAAVPQAPPQTTPGGPPARQAVVRKTTKLGNSRRLPDLGSMAPGLCFQPGVGWQRILAGPPAASAARASNDAAGEANPQSLHAKLLSAKQAHSAECAGGLPDRKALGADVETLAVFDPNRTIRSTVSTKPGSFISLRAKSPFHPDGSAALNLGRMTPSAMPSDPMSSASEKGRDDSSDQVSDRTFHAYISPIKLRRLMRNAPDFKSRMKMQQLQSGLATKLDNAKVDTKTGQEGRRPLQGERVRATSGWGSERNGSPPRQSQKTSFRGSGLSAIQ
jgi:hypothetical protein